jgi:hypothetical protein
MIKDLGLSSNLNLGNRLGNTVNKVLQPFGLQIATNVPFFRPNT